MSRTFRKKIKSSKIIRDGERQYADSSCRHHGSCDYCKNNRTFEKAISLRDELKLMGLENDLSRTHDNQIYLRERQILSYTWDVLIYKIDLIYCEPIGELCIYVDNIWRGYLDENLPLTDGHSWFVISNGKYIGIDEPLNLGE